MSNIDFLLELYCLVDENLQYVMPPQGLRPHGPAPTLADAEVITIEIASSANRFSTRYGRGTRN